MNFTWGAKAATTLLAAVLLIPVAGIRLQDRHALEALHNRSLNRLPERGSFGADPAAWYRQWQKWLADRVYPIREATLAHSKLLFYGLHTPPQRRVTLASDGFIFLNGGREDQLNEIFDSVCIRAHSEPVVKALGDALPAIDAYARRRQLAVDIVVMPTSATLYGDHLPRSVPQRFRAACSERAAGRAPLNALNAVGAPLLTYPFDAMRAARDAPGFFPQGNWHADGLSVKVARDAYLERVRLQRPTGERIENGQGPAELLQPYGIEWMLPIARVVNTGVTADAARAGQAKAQLADLFDSPYFEVQAFGNAQAVNRQAVLMLTDSYGNLSAPVFAGAFAQLLQVNTNVLKEGKVAALIDRVLATAPLDRVILLVQEGGTERLVAWSKTLAADTAGPAAPRTDVAAAAAGASAPRR